MAARRQGARESQAPPSAKESGMAIDEQWVEDVKRWVLGAHDATEHDASGDEVAIGVEAAQPALQARHWPDAPTTDR